MRQEICHRASKCVLTVCASDGHAMQRAGLVACHDGCTLVDVQLFSLLKSASGPGCLCVCARVNVLATSWCEDSTPSLVISSP